ncbi:c-type cytochrome [Antarcticirhabdus aurantiaca]|uniref:Cytochrome c n=1 Tax=Antarcticirhabdus aurantiaca TaxID=2606717 RepID=A0ACD4NIC3_9HYPH|nr:cytochrome c [Antarcticirhabdus aurantiaca]WAJ26570.1 cytochrome c [Jeongeuplla avenae]
MLERTLAVVFGLAVVGGGAFYVLTTPRPLDAATLGDGAGGDVARGERIFHVGGCISCHAAERPEVGAQPLLAGGEPLETPFGTFHGPNISPHPTDGIGAWSYADFANAMKRGLDPEGRHLYPAFPYTSYVKMRTQDLADLWAYMKSLPPAEGRAPANELAFPFNIRRGVGLWKLAFLPEEGPIVPLAPDAPEPVKLGQYLVEGPGHCGQCHTPRSFNGAGGLIETQWLAGAPNPEGRGGIPDITPGGETGSWSESDLVEYFASGFTPDFDSVGGSMADVQRNLAELSDADRDAIAAYLKAVPPIDERGEAAPSQ